MSRARIVAFLTSVLLLWAVGLPAPARYFCRMMDRVLDECCCPSESTIETVRSESEVRSADCCVRLTQGALPTADARQELVQPGSMPALLVGSELLQVSPAFQSDVLDATRGENEAVLARGPPLFLKHCVFLI